MSSPNDSFQNITIVGLGLIGGSWGLALREQGLRATRTGYDRPEILRLAVERGIVDRGALDFPAAVRDADLIILATPVAAILDLLPQLKGAIKPTALVTDTGSTKRLICRRAAEVFDGADLFVGGHPLAGKERSGLEQAEAGLFKGARYVLTPRSPDDLEDRRVKAFVELVKAAGALPFVTDPTSHDRAVAFLSHLPQLVSTGLASLIAEQGAEDFLPPELAASGFRDVTRLAESPYNVWRDICLTNIENIQSALESLIEKLEDMKMHLSDRELEREFKQALKLREKLREIR
ncbi:MAG TPA: prephenate dehydrogenase/arogenate dehydrogenase family protein [Terriglobia bacterium]|nr:prephenate dehydrogenase/arogenate dehydrogenase family protein [Terriglobia bacterium]